MLVIEPTYEIIEKQIFSEGMNNIAAAFGYETTEHNIDDVLRHLNITVQMGHRVYEAVKFFKELIYQEGALLEYADSYKYKNQPKFLNDLYFTSATNSKYIISASAYNWKQFFGFINAILKSTTTEEGKKHFIIYLAHEYKVTGVEQLGALLNTLIDFNTKYRIVETETLYNTNNRYRLNILTENDIRDCDQFEREVHFTLTVKMTISRQMMLELLQFEGITISEIPQIAKEDLTFIRPPKNVPEEGVLKWIECCAACEKEYLKLMCANTGVGNEPTAFAKVISGILPTQVSTNVIVTAPVYVWKNIFNKYVKNVSNSQLRDVLEKLFLELLSNMEIAYIFI